MAELDTTLSDAATATAPAPALTAREKRDLQKNQLRPLANRRPELYGILTSGE